MLCVRGNFILGDVNVSTHNITIPYVLYADGRIASSPHEIEWPGINMSYNVTQEHAAVLNSDRITENTSGQTRLPSVSDENTGRYNLTSASDNITIIGIAQGNNSFIEPIPKVHLL